MQVNKTLQTFKQVLAGGLCTVVIKPWSQTLYIICESAYLYFD